MEINNVINWTYTHTLLYTSNEKHFPVYKFYRYQLSDFWIAIQLKWH